MITKLSKCPRCGSRPSIWYGDYFGIKYLVKCNHCGFKTIRKYSAEKAARTAWNTLVESFSELSDKTNEDIIQGVTR